MSENKFTRTGSGTWRLDGLGTQAAPAAPISGPPPGAPRTGNNPAFQPRGGSGPLPPAEPPRAGASGRFPALSAKPAAAPSAPPASSPPRPQPRGLPSDPAQRASYLGELARQDLEAQRWASAESNLMLALGWDAGNAEHRRLLEEVRRTREEQRKGKK